MKGIKVFVFCFSICWIDASLNAQVNETIPQNENLIVVDQMPEFPGGPSAMYEYIFRQIEYPRKCAKKGISGKVVLKFTLDTFGQITNIHILQSVAPEIDAEAIRVIESMNHMKKRWEPGRHEGRAVNVDFTLPIKFVLQ